MAPRARLRRQRRRAYQGNALGFRPKPMLSAESAIHVTAPCRPRHKECPSGPNIPFIEFHMVFQQ